MNVLFLTRYGLRAASTRQRFWQFFPELTDAGINCDLSPLLDDSYLDAVFAGRPFGKRSLARLYAGRLKELVGARRYDVVVIHFEAFPFLPPWFEWLLARRRIPFIVDLDDAIFHRYDQHPNPLVRLALGKKIAKLMSWASAVQCGSAYLHAYASQYNKRSIIVPTVVKESEIEVRKRERQHGERMIIGWIGSPSTAVYLKEIAEPLGTACRDNDMEVHIVGAGSVELDGIPCKGMPWTPETERAALRSFHVGVMPLTNDPWSRGKCGFKLIQYMAAGLPVIASPVGANQTIVRPGINGYLPSTSREWLDAIQDIFDSPTKAHAYGQAGRRIVESEYSYSLSFGLLKKNLLSVAGYGSSGDVHHATLAE